MKTIYLIRHGETEYNKRGIVQGSGVDSDLNDTGRAQAAAFFETYEQVRFDKVYTSELRRTMQSVERFITEKRIPHEIQAGLNEISWGTREGKVIREEEDNYYHAMIKAWSKGQTDFAIDGGESPAQVLERQKPFIEQLLSQEQEKTVLICMHGRAMRILLSHILGYDLKDMDMFEHSNLCLYRLMYRIEDKSFEIDLYNDTGHFAAIDQKSV